MSSLLLNNFVLVSGNGIGLIFFAGFKKNHTGAWVEPHCCWQSLEECKARAIAGIHAQSTKRGTCERTSLTNKMFAESIYAPKNQARRKVKRASVSSWIKSKSAKLSIDMKSVYFIGFINTACICTSLKNKAFVIQAPKWIQVESVIAVNEHRDSLKGLLSFQINKLLWLYLIHQKKEKRTIWQPGGKIKW